MNPIRLLAVPISLILLLATGCASAPKQPVVPDLRDTDPLIVQLSATARKAFDRGDLAAAVTLYQRALERARAMDNPREIGRNAHNLAAPLLVLDRTDEALRLLAEAERETLRAGDDAGPIRMMRARAGWQRGALRDAEATLDRLETDPITPEVRAEAYLLRAHIACDRNDPARAEAHLARARGLIPDTAEPARRGGLLQVAGRIALLRGDAASAAAAFDAEADAWGAAGRLREMADALGRAGAQHARAGDPAAAADRIYRAARSLVAQGEVVAALRVLETHVPTDQPDATHAVPGDDTVDAAIAALFEDIRASVQASGELQD
jgi:tetratricopeptide (TPR) repeat protein